MNDLKFTVTIERARLRAALLFSAVKDIRYYLNGVLFQVSECHDSRLVATDGHRLAIIKTGDVPDALPGDYLIPYDAIKAIKKGARGFNNVDLEISGDEFLFREYGGILSGGKLLDGKFPDYQRVIPRIENMTGEAGSFNAAYLADIQKALIELGQKLGAFKLHQNGPNNSAVTIDAGCGFLCVVMPLKTDPAPTQSEADSFFPRRMPRAIIETASGGGAFPCDPLQDVGDKRGAVDAGQAAPVAHCAADVADWIDPAGTMRAAGLLIVGHVGDKAPAAVEDVDPAYMEYLQAVAA
jgi:DNA polymerase-3 subunit beta